MTVNELRNFVVSTAEMYNGCKESDGSHKKIIDIYNAHKPLARGYKVKYDDAWCATFVSAVAIQCGLTGIIPTECSCNQMIDLLKKKNAWVENDKYIPKPGDIIFYDWQDSGKGDNIGSSDHVGIVTDVTNGYIRVIEGNTMDRVGYRNIKVNARTIRGFGVPKYETKATVKPVLEIAQEVIAGKWGNNPDRKRRLIEAGYDYNAVQNKVNELLKKPLQDVAKEVVKGLWGNGAERKKRLTEAGYDYDAVQKIVNSML